MLATSCSILNAFDATDSHWIGHDISNETEALSTWPAFEYCYPAGAKVLTYSLHPAYAFTQSYALNSAPGPDCHLCSGFPLGIFVELVM